jgi:hypothetical protein
MADLTPNDNPPTSSDAPGDAGKNGNRRFPAAAGTHRSTGRWQRYLSTARRWARDTFNREQLVAGMKQLMWVAPLTMLIWIYAERAQQVDDTIRVTIAAASSDPKTAVRLADPPDGSVLMNITGPRSRIDELHRTVESRQTPVRFEIPPGLPTGLQHLLEVKQAVQMDSRFAGVTVTGSQPPRVNVAVDRLEVLTVPVQLRPEDRATFEQAVFVPAAVKVSCPAKTFSDALKSNVVVYADLSRFPDMTPGPKSDVRGIPVKVDKAENLPDVTIEPSTISVSLTVRPKNAAVIIPSLLIREEDDSLLLRNGVDVKFERTVLGNVRLQGPPDGIAAINLKELDNTVRAVVTLTAADLSQTSPFKKEIRFDLPPGVKFVSSLEFAEGQPPIIDVTITKRSAGE